MREKAQTWSANARLYLLRLREPAGVVSPVMASERPLAACAFEGALSLEVGGCRTSCCLRLLAAGAPSVAVWAAGAESRRFAARRLSRAQLLCDAHRRAGRFRHAARASHDASRDPSVNGERRAGRSTL